jgi:phytoene/squalene synthetase
MSADPASSRTEPGVGDTSAYIAGEVRRHDRDRFLAALFAPPAYRADLWALYAFNAEVARIPDSVSEPMLGRIKVQWWRDVIGAIADGRGAPAGHPVAQALAATMTARGLTRQWLDDLLTARDAEFDQDGFTDITAMEEHADATAGRLAWLALEVLQVSDAVSRDVTHHTAIGYALAGMLRTIPHNAARNRLMLPRDLMASAGVSLAGIQSGQDRAALRIMAEQIAARARHHLGLAKALSRMADRRAMPVLLWWTLADRALNVMARVKHDVFDLRMMAYRPSVLPLLWRSWRGRL